MSMCPIVPRQCLDSGSHLIGMCYICRGASDVHCLPAGTSLDRVSVRRPDHSHMELAVSHMHRCADRAQSLCDVRGVSSKGRLGRICQPGSDGAGSFTPRLRSVQLNAGDLSPETVRKQMLFVWRRLDTPCIACGSRNCCELTIQRHTYRGIRTEQDINHAPQSTGSQ